MPTSETSPPMDGKVLETGDSRQATPAASGSPEPPSPRGNHPQHSGPSPHRAAGGPRSRSMLVPIAYSESAMPALRLTRSSRLIRRVAKLLLVSMFVAIGMLAFVPWQQSATGSGTVIAFSPSERLQVIESPTKGRIVRWGDNVVENSHVTKGTFLCEIRDLDDDYSSRLEQQLANTRLTVIGSKQQFEASKQNLVATKMVVDSFERNVRAYTTVKVETAASQDAFVEMAEKKVAAEMQQFNEVEAALPQLEAEVARVRVLQAEGNVALQKLQEVERKLSEAKAKVQKAKEYVASAKAELEAKRRDRVAKIEKAQVDIDYAEAAVRKARADVAKTESDVAKASQDVAKAEKEVLEMEVKVARQSTQTIVAPMSGFITQISPNLGSGVLKEGDTICTIVPDSTERAVQVWLDGNDTPLVTPGRHVRLQFEGWPALQFAGWPSVAIGTFGGEVVSIDATDNGKGKFRILVRPDESSYAWPAPRFLRQGVKAHAWVILNRVPLWFEVWRQLNGFPRTITSEPGKESDGDKKAKPPKMPK